MVMSILLVQRGAASPLPHCGSVMRKYNATYSSSNEGRLRPSLIAALKFCGGGVQVFGNEGRLRPSLIAAWPR